MTIQEMNALKEKLNVTYQDICIVSGLPLSTVQKVMGGATKNPRIGTIDRLDKALRQLACENENADAGGRTENVIAVKGTFNPESSEGQARNRAKGTDKDTKGSESAVSGGSYLEDIRKRERGFRQEMVHEGMVHEDYGVYGSGQYRSGGTAARQQRLWTAAQREAFPDERRTELIDGVLYDMASPSVMHQSIELELYVQIRSCIAAHHADCQAFVAPTDVYLDRNQYTVVQPDIFIICDKGQITRRNIQGAPELVMEILSSSTKKKDQTVKLVKYVEAGVKEYWTIDPDKRHIVVYDMTGNTKETPPDGRGYEVSLFGFHDKVPLRISDGKCSIDMNLISDLLDHLY